MLDRIPRVCCRNATETMHATVESAFSAAKQTIAAQSRQELKRIDGREDEAIATANQLLAGGVAFQRSLPGGDREGGEPCVSPNTVRVVRALEFLYATRPLFTKIWEGGMAVCRQPPEARPPIVQPRVLDVRVATVEATTMLGRVFSLGTMDETEALDVKVPLGAVAIMREMVNALGLPAAPENATVFALDTVLGLITKSCAPWFATPSVATAVLGLVAELVRRHRTPPTPPLMRMIVTILDAVEPRATFAVVDAWADAVFAFDEKTWLDGFRLFLEMDGPAVFTRMFARLDIDAATCIRACSAMASLCASICKIVHGPPHVPGYRPLPCFDGIHRAAFAAAAAHPDSLELQFAVCGVLERRCSLSIQELVPGLEHVLNAHWLHTPLVAKVLGVVSAARYSGIRRPCDPAEDMYGAFGLYYGALTHSPPAPNSPQILRMCCEFVGALGSSSSKGILHFPEFLVKVVTALRRSNPEDLSHNNVLGNVPTLCAHLSRAPEAVASLVRAGMGPHPVIGLLLWAMDISKVSFVQGRLCSGLVPSSCWIDDLDGLRSNKLQVIARVFAALERHPLESQVVPSACRVLDYMANSTDVDMRLALVEAGCVERGFAAACKAAADENKRALVVPQWCGVLCSLCLHPSGMDRAVTVCTLGVFLPSNTTAIECLLGFIHAEVTLDDVDESTFEPTLRLLQLLCGVPSLCRAMANDATLACLHSTLQFCDPPELPLATVSCDIICRLISCPGHTITSLTFLLPALADTICGEVPGEYFDENHDHSPEHEIAAACKAVYTIAADPFTHPQIATTPDLVCGVFKAIHGFPNSVPLQAAARELLARLQGGHTPVLQAPHPSSTQPPPPLPSPPTPAKGVSEPTALPLSSDHGEGPSSVPELAGCTSAESGIAQPPPALHPCALALELARAGPAYQKAALDFYSGLVEAETPISTELGVLLVQCLLGVVAIYTPIQIVLEPAMVNLVWLIERAESEEARAPLCAFMRAHGMPTLVLASAVVCGTGNRVCELIATCLWYTVPADPAEAQASADFVFMAASCVAAAMHPSNLPRTQTDLFQVALRLVLSDPAAPDAGLTGGTFPAVLAKAFVVDSVLAAMVRYSEDPEVQANGCALLRKLYAVLEGRTLLAAPQRRAVLEALVGVGIGHANMAVRVAFQAFQQELVAQVATPPF